MSGFKSLLPVAVALLSSVAVTSALAQQAGSLERELSNAGWSAQRNEDGSLILRPPVHGTPAPPSADQTVPQSNTQALKERLRDQGWGVEQEPDGTLVLHPPQVPVVQQPGQQGAAKGDDKASPLRPLVAEPQTAVNKDLVNALRARNWQVEVLGDGALIVRRPVAAQESGSAEVFDPGCGPWTAPVLAEGGIELPVNEWAEAHRIAQQWLDQQAPNGLLVGKIRKVLKVYLVSIVSDRRPFELVHQVVIRSHDGRVLFIH